MHVQPGYANEETRTAKLFLLVMVAQDMANILTEKTFDTLAKLLDAIDVALVHLPFDVWARAEWRNLSVDLVVPGYVGYQISDDWKTLHRLDSNGFIYWQSIHAGLARQSGTAIDFCRTRAALACFAVPPDRKVRRQVSLNVMKRIEHNHTRRDRYFVLNQLTASAVTAKNFECCVRHCQ
jgi:hypothetical protein